jgi:hypothetical protein
LEVFRKVCDAVSFAHSRGYLHRDLKPENVMVGEFGEVLVMDWGLAKKLSRSRGSQEGAGILEVEPETLPYIEGTPQFMSPEQAEGLFGGLDERSDIYSLGGILYAILTLRAPVTGASVQDVLEKVRKGETTTMLLPAGGQSVGGVVQMGEGLPESLKAVTLKAMALERKRRYHSVQAFAQDLEAYQAGFATSAEHASLLKQLVLLAKRNRAASVLLGLLLLCAFGFTLRLAASERQARHNALQAVQEAEVAAANAKRADLNAKSAEESAEIAAANALTAQSNADKALAQKEAARLSAARAQLALGIEQVFGDHKQADALAARRGIGQTRQHQMHDVADKVMVARADEDFVATEFV